MSVGNSVGKRDRQMLNMLHNQNDLDLNALFHGPSSVITSMSFSQDVLNC